MSDEGAAGALAAAVAEALRGMTALSQVSDGRPIQAGDAAATIEIGPRTDWGHKSGEGAEVRFSVTISCGGEQPRRARALIEQARARIAGIGPVLGPSTGSGQAGWRLVTLVPVRMLTARAAGPGWVASTDYRARMMRE